jgi:osmotically-inducible protein OsmY
MLKDVPVIAMKHVFSLMLILALAGCAPYVLAVRETYDVATDPRSVMTQATDTQAELQIKAALLASPVRGTSGIDVYCRQGVVVLVGVVPPGSKEEIRAVLIADPVLISGRVDIAVYAGHVVLVGVVDSRANVQKFIADARSVPGVVSVTSYIQTV